MIAIVVTAVLVFATTLAGGYFALKFRDKLHIIVGFAAGAVLGIAFLDLIPEAVELIDDGHLASSIALGAVLVYIILDRTFFGHSHAHDHEDHSHAEGRTQDEHPSRGIVRAASLVLHSFIDGLAVGFSYQVSTATGIVVAVAVLAHNFSDGINTVGAILKGGTVRRAKSWLMVNALAPVAGIAAGSVVAIGEFALGVVVSVFAGFFVYIALADMIPESFHRHPKKLTTIATILGVLFVYIVINLAGHH